MLYMPFLIAWLVSYLLSFLTTEIVAGAPWNPDLQNTLGTLTNHAMKSLQSLVSAMRGIGNLIQH